MVDLIKAAIYPVVQLLIVLLVTAALCIVLGC